MPNAAKATSSNAIPIIAAMRSYVGASLHSVDSPLQPGGNIQLAKKIMTSIGIYEFSYPVAPWGTRAARNSKRSETRSTIDLEKRLHEDSWAGSICKCLEASELLY